MIAVLLASAVLAQGGSGAEELWERYPLDPTPTPTTQAAPQGQSEATERDEGQVQIVETGDGDGFGTAGLVALIAVAATGGAAALRFAQLAARKRRVAASGAVPAVANGSAPAAAPPAPARSPRPARASKSRAPTSAASSAQPASDASSSPPAPAPRRKRPATPRPAHGAAPSPPRRERRPPPRPQRPAPEPGAAPPTRRFAPSAAGSEWELCRIRLWRGYVTRCYIAQSEGTDAPIARSPSFKAVSTPEATAALQEMVADLRGKGWEQVHDTDGAWHGWMRRPAGARTAG